MTWGCSLNYVSELESLDRSWRVDESLWESLRSGLSFRRRKARRRPTMARVFSSMSLRLDTLGLLSMHKLSWRVLLWMTSLFVGTTWLNWPEGGMPQLAYHKWGSFYTAYSRICCLSPSLCFFRKEMEWMVFSERILEIVGSSSLVRFEFPRLSLTRTQAKTSSNNTSPRNIAPIDTLPKDHWIFHGWTELNWVELDPRKTGDARYMCP